VLTAPPHTPLLTALHNPEPFAPESTRLHHTAVHLTDPIHTNPRLPRAPDSAEFVVDAALPWDKLPSLGGARLLKRAGVKVDFK
jgi:hypothetical protein